MLSALAESLMDERVADAVGGVLDGWAAKPSFSAIEARAAEARIAPVFACSPMLLQLGSRWPDLLFELLSDCTPHAVTVDQHKQALATALASPEASTQAQASDEAHQLMVLRHHRQQQMLRILWQDLERRNSVQHTLTELTALADASVQVALEWAHATLAARFGEPADEHGQTQQMIVLGMGKLGGGELNVSSDIDLIYLFPEAGQTLGPKVLDNSEFFRRVAQRLTRLLHTTTADGFVFRVDTRLRPFGESGPLVVSLDGLEHYLLTQGRDWERYAMIKARALTGSTEGVAALLALIQPFVYRRYLDYNAVDALRQLKLKIAASVRERGLQGNIKLGAGGIREIEFIAQAFQLVRGGRMQELQQRPTRAVLKTLAELQLLEPSLTSKFIRCQPMKVINNACWLCWIFLHGLSFSRH